MFFSEDGAQNRKKVSMPEVGVHFGFPVAVDDRDGRTAWVVPARADSERMTIDGGLFVARTSDGGQSIVLVTNNVREFEQVPGLRLENWANGS